tara:strand:+ start:3591 stop:5876 length:2286 start_codon:yes stop_codon:yes gene_type:complete
MLRLVLWDSTETYQYDIDLYENIPVEVTYQFSDIQNINSSTGNYSQTFRIPASKSNLDFFGAVIMPSVASTGTLINGNFDIKKKIKAELSEGGITIVTGFVQVKGIYRQKKLFHELEIILFGETIDLAKKLGDKMLSDLDMSGLNHVLDLANIEYSWLAPSTNPQSPFAGNVRYGVMDKGFNWNNNIPENVWMSEPAPLHQGKLTPYVRVRWILDQIFSEAGFTYTSAFFSHADFDKVMIPAFNGALSPIGTAGDPNGQLAGAGLATNYTLPFATPVDVPFLDTVTDGYDFGGNFDNTTHRYTAPTTAIYTFRVNITPVYLLSLESSSQLFVDPASGSAYQFGPQFYTHYTQQPTANDTRTLSLFAGDEVYLQSFGYGASGGVLNSGAVNLPDTTWFTVENISEPLQGQTIDFSANMPVCKQIDFLASLQKMYNLVIIPDKITPKKVLIEPYMDYTSVGVIKKDWTNKIDFSKDVEIKPTTDIQKQVYSWQNSSGGDFVNESVLKSLDRVYGRYKVQDPENDFATGEKAITTSFASYILSYIPGTAYPIHRLIDDSGESISKPLPRICNYLGQSAGFWLMNDVGGSSPQPFPLMSNYDAVAPSVADQDLNFGTELAFIAMPAHPANTLYWKYWAKYVSELYSRDSRIMTLFVNLSNVDIHNFKFSDNIYIENEYWRILSIENYDATTTVPTKVTFIKVLSDLPLCADIPTGYESGRNMILFNNSSSDYGSKSCCEQYGYVWQIDALGGHCYATSIQLTPTI